MRLNSHPPPPTHHISAGQSSDVNGVMVEKKTAHRLVQIPVRRFTRKKESVRRLRRRSSQQQMRVH